MQRFIVRKYIMAKDAKQAIKLDKTTPVQDVWIDDEWKKLNDDITRNIGF